jgi:hypothetical protein
MTKTTKSDDSTGVGQPLDPELKQWTEWLGQQQKDIALRKLETRLLEDDIKKKYDIAVAALGHLQNG